jgi:nitroimidazol reductase NimA-like FMN-containing flavoprotein (pyridoxamine 5'-phosphate oxidase superfamily)
MRRTDKEITNRKEIDDILHEARVCRLALAVQDEPYLVPVSFGYDGDNLYFHTAKTGRKLDFIQNNPRVCFEVERNVRVVPHPSEACKFTIAFESAIGYGTITELVAPEEKMHAFHLILAHYADGEWQIPPEKAANTRVWRLSVESVTGKRSKPKAD